MRRRVSAATAIPGNWFLFFRVNENKMDLFAFLTQVTLKCFDGKGKELVITDGEAVHNKPPLEDYSLCAITRKQTVTCCCILHMLQSTATTRF